jgi:hypothetical protein
MALTITKPSFWRTDREFRDDTRMLIGKFRFVNAWQTKAEGEAEGRKLFFSYPGWDSRYSEMSESGGVVVARFEPVGWWGTWYKLTYKGKDYRWRMNGWGTEYVLYDGETEVLRVKPGGYLKPGTATVSGAMSEKDALPLVQFSLYLAYLIAAQAAAGASVAS